MDGITRDAVTASSVVDAAAAGDAIAFARLVAAYHADMIRVAFVVSGGDQDAADDAVQAAWAIAWQKLVTLRQRDRVRPWLVAVAANEARQSVRRRHRQAVVELRVGSADREEADPAAGIERVDLVNALGHLTPEDRALLAMRYVAGLDSTELGRSLGMSASGTRARLGRLLERMRKDLGHD